MDNDVKQEREAAQILWDAISDEYNKWSNLSELERNEFTKAIAAWQTRQPQTDALKMAREALEAAPLIGRTESVNDFMARQNAWLNGPYRAALEQSK